jgi:hypothetical protein
MSDKLDELIAEVRDVSPTINPQKSEMVVREAGMFRITCGQLRGLCEKYPNHPHAAIFRSAVAGEPNEMVRIVERIDLIAMIEGMEVEFYTEDEIIDVGGLKNKVKTERKRLVPLGTSRQTQPTQNVIQELRSSGAQEALPGQPAPESEVVVEPTDME